MTRRPLPLFGETPPPRPPVLDRHPFLTDTFGRRHTNLRVSVTDRCNLRCTYCMPEDVTFLDRGELLTFEELTRVVRVAAGLGVDKVRLTGGEPLMRRGLPELVAMTAAVPGVRDLGLTTNGLLLAAQARALLGAGLRRVNVSLDTLDPVRFRQIARRPGLERVTEGVAAARAVGLGVKLNAVVVRGVNDCDVGPLAAFARAHGCEMRYIESMPIGADPWDRDAVVTADEILDTVAREVGPLVPVGRGDPHAPAAEYEYVDGGGRVGVIASVTRPFCSACNRLRLTADGKLRNCLFSLDEVDVKRSLRVGADDEIIADAFRRSVASKWEGHEINSARFVKPERTMHAIGG